MNKISNQEKQLILIQMNFPAPLITDKEVERILNNKLVEFDKYWILWLEDFFGLPKTSFTEKLLKQFQEINTAETFMNVVPSIQKLLKPLKDSCKAYSLSLYSASIALSGMASESLAMLLWEMHGLSIQKIPITDAQKKAILGRKFERLEQNRKIEVLKRFDWIKNEQKTLFDNVRNARNRYLHSWHEDFRNEKKEALSCYKETFKLFREITGVKLKNASSVEANPLLTQWMKNKTNL